MGSFLSGVLGTGNDYETSNPYNPVQLQGAVNRQGQLYDQQQGLAQALQAQASGQGPNPAQTQYMQNVQNNVANAQGLASSQRGINPALAAKMGSNIGAQANQQAAAQSGLMQAQQQLGAQANLGNLYGQMQSGNLGQQQLYNQANLGAQGINANVASGNQQQSGKLVGGLLGGAAAMMAHGGLVHNYSEGGITNSGDMPQSALAQSLSAMAQSLAQPMTQQDDGMFAKGMSAIGKKGGEAMMSPAQVGVYKGGEIKDYKSGGSIKGKAKVSGDSPKNDTVPAMLSPGEAVIPRSVMNSEDAPDKARDFIAALLAHQNMGKNKK